MAIFEGKNPVTVAMITVLIVVGVIAVFSGDISGFATKSVQVNLKNPLYVGKWSHSGWGLCTGAIPWESVDKLCKSYKDKQGKLIYSGALPEGKTGRPCRHDKIGTAYVWDLEVPLHLGDYSTQNGFGLTAIKCVPM